MRLSRRQQLAIVGGILGVVLLGLLVWHYIPALRLIGSEQFSRRHFIQLFRGRGWVAVVPITLLVTVVTMIPGAPSSVVAILSGVCLGAPLGFAANVVGISLGNSIGSLFIHRLEDLRKKQKQSRILDDLLKMRHPRIGVMLGYAVPFIPNVLVHFAAGKLQIERRSWELLILIGSVPTAFFYAFGGDAVLHLKLSRIIIAAVVIGASAGLIWLIHRDRKITTQ
ncbi:MAG: TVP38/TMEM64 family protein [Lactobacillus sp.]|nr:MAG: TVP38/TMEM64 family protein [Lactobacillus sp.]